MNRRLFIGSTSSYICSLTTLGAFSAGFGFVKPSLAAPAYVDIDGQKFENEVNLASQKLVLNGAGIRYKLVFKMYAMGLYLPKKSQSVEEILAMPGPKRIQMFALRSMPIAEFGRHTAQGIQNNATREDFVKILPDIVRIGQVYSNRRNLTAVGDEVRLDWIPQRGLVMYFKGVPQGEPFTQPELFRSILKIWLGDKPADAQLKSALLGHVTQHLENSDEILN